MTMTAKQYLAKQKEAAKLAKALDALQAELAEAATTLRATVAYERRDTGTVILIKGKKVDGESYPGSISSNTVVGEDGKTRWQTDGKKTIYSGKQFWWSKHQAFFKELIDTRGTNDVASPLGEWTKVECVCNGAKITIKINGVTVNECFDANPAAGQILLQSEGHEVFFRNMEIRPLQ